MGFCKRASYLLLIAILYFLSGCKSTKPVFLFNQSDFEPTFYAQVSDSAFIVPQSDNEFPKAKKTVVFSTKKVNSLIQDILKLAPLTSSETRSLKSSTVGNNLIVIKSRFNLANQEQNQKVLALNKNAKKQNKIPIPLLIAIGVLTAIIITLFVFLDDIFAKVTKNDFHIEAFLLSILFILSIIAWIILVINLFLLLPAVYFGVFLGTLLLGFFIWRGIKRYKKTKAN